MYYLKTYDAAEREYFEIQSFDTEKEAKQAFKESPLKNGKLVIWDPDIGIIKSRHVSPWNHWFIKHF